MTPKGVADDQLGHVAVRQWELFRRVKEGTLDPEWVVYELQLIIEGKSAFGEEELSILLTDWKWFYRDLFGLEVDFSSLSVPAKRKDFNRLIVVAQGMTPQRLYDKSAELFPCWKSNIIDIFIDGKPHNINIEDLNKVWSERTAKDGFYAVWFRDAVVGDEDLANLSANDLKKKNIPCITLEERLLMELKYFKETENHLDTTSFTLCTGSRYPYGKIPRVRWCPLRRCLEIFDEDPDKHDHDRRSRRAVL